MLLNLHNKTIHTFHVVAIYKSSPLYLQLLSWDDVCSVGGVTEVYAVHFILKCGPQKMIIVFVIMIFLSVVDYHVLQKLEGASCWKWNAKILLIF